jgi:diguanylate cyclase (GGDEF)-like protein/PAS domain S-box-containing protein
MSLSVNAYFLVAHIIAVGICISVFAQSAMIALGDTNKLVYRYFSALALVAALYLGSTAYYYQAGSLALAVIALKIQITAICLSYPILIKFVEMYSGGRSSKLFIPIILIVSLLLIINYLSPYSLRYLSLEASPKLYLPWGEELNRYHGQINPYRSFGWIGMIIYVWGILQGVRLYKRGVHSKGILLSLSLILILIAGIWGMLIDLGQISSFYIAGFGFLSLVMMMNFQLAKEYQALSNQIAKNNDELALSALAFEAHDAIMILERDFNITRVNKSFEDYTGYSAEDLIGKPAAIFDTEKCNAAFYQDLKQTLILKGEWIGHAEVKHKNGAILPVFAKFTLLKGASDQIRNVVCIYSNLSEIKKQEEYLDFIQNTDQLTGLLTKQYFVAQLADYLNLQSDTNPNGALVFINLDNFKSINDAYGHTYGDLLLFITAFRLKQLIKPTDLIARIGADEFLVFLKNRGTNETQVSQAAADFAGQALQVISEKYSLSQHECFITASIGVKLSLGQSKNPFELMKRADIAMTAAESRGGNCVQFFESSLQDIAERNTHLQFDLHHAIGANQLQLYYQLQVNQDLMPVGAEALIRWNHPEKGLILPLEFIPLAEKSVLIKQIGHWVLHAACQQLELWSHQSAAKHLKLSVNVSAIQLMDADFVDQVKSIMATYDTDPSLLKFEITEAIAIGDVNLAIETMLLLKQKIGIQLSIDDFGTGYSSLSQLKNLPIDELKIDRSFIRNITKNKTDEMVVKTIVDLGKNLNFDIVAEGIEYKEQYQLLKNLGCYKYQGYLFAKPLPADDFDLHLLILQYSSDA